MEEKIRLYTVSSLEQKTIPHPDNVQNLQKKLLNISAFLDGIVIEIIAILTVKNIWKRGHSIIVLFFIPLVENSFCLGFFLSIKSSKIKLLGKYLLVSVVTKTIKSSSDGWQEWRQTSVSMGYHLDPQCLIPVYEKQWQPVIIVSSVSWKVTYMWTDIKPCLLLFSKPWKILKNETAHHISTYIK